jgi:TRAP transporter TAXI family solute receptor
MNRLKYLFSIFLITVAIISITVISSQKELKSDPGKLTFVSGFEGGTYYKIGDSLNKLPGMEFEVLTTKGTNYNIKMLIDKKADLGLAQMDIWTSYYNKQEDKSVVKIVLPIYTEEVHIIVQKGMKTLADLKGKKISIGPDDSGSNATGKIILKSLGINPNGKNIDKSSPKDALNKLLKKEIDALFIVAGAPIELLSKLSSKKAKAIKLLPVDNDFYINLLAETGIQYIKGFIKKKKYKWLKKDVPAILVYSAIIARKDLPDSTVTNLTKGIIKNIKTLSKKHNKWKEFVLKQVKFYALYRAKYFHPAAVKVLNSM